MYDSVLLRTVTRILLPLVLVLSIFMLLRGYDAPGSGFACGLLAASGLVLAILVFGPTRVRATLPRNPVLLAAAGILGAVLFGCLSLLTQQPFLTTVWLGQTIPGLVVSTPQLFNVGVYLVVVGVTTWLALLLAEEVVAAKQLAPHRAPQVAPGNAAAQPGEPPPPDLPHQAIPEHPAPAPDNGAQAVEDGVQQMMVGSETLPR